jgi:hypothetical protein
LLASGRDADIFEYGPGLVLRRSRAGHSMALEARIMEYARAHGYPVPAVDHVSDDGTELVLERLDGPTMLAILSRRPWTIREHGRCSPNFTNSCTGYRRRRGWRRRRADTATVWCTSICTRSM